MKLNLGCGSDYKEGWVNIDHTLNRSLGVRPDKVMDLLRLPWDFPNDSASEILAQHVLEHIPHNIGEGYKDGLLCVMEQIHRVLKPNGILHIAYPAPSRPTAELLADPTHTRVLSLKTWEYFGANGLSYYSKARFRLEAHWTVRKKDRGIIKSWHFRRLGMPTIAQKVDSGLGRAIEERVILRKV